MGKAIPEVMRRAFFQLRNGRPGPVLIEVPVDVFGEDVPDRLGATSRLRSAKRHRTRRCGRSSRRAREGGTTRDLRRPGRALRRGLGELKALAEAWKIPVTTSLEGKSAFPETHPLSLGSGRPRQPAAGEDVSGEADVILGIGCSFALTGFGVPMPRGKTIIHATLDPMDLNKDVPAQYALIGDAKLTLQG